jgi:copper homeostasis protein CutC
MLLTVEARSPRAGIVFGVPTMPTFQTEIMRAAKALAALQRKAKNQRAAVKHTETLIRQAKKELRVLVNAGTKATADEWHESGAASKVHGTTAGE